MIATLEHLMQIHARNALCSFFSVVIIIDIDNQAPQELSHLASYFYFELIKLPFLEVICNIVVGKEIYIFFFKPFTIRRLTGTGVASGAFGRELNPVGWVDVMGCEIRRRRQKA
jgi:hypothetical protein